MPGTSMIKTRAEAAIIHVVSPLFSAGIAAPGPLGSI
jgi:hypothetical protein